MKDGSVCSNPSSSAEAETAATSPAHATYTEAAAVTLAPPPPALDIVSPIHSPTHSNTYTPPAPSWQAQTIIVGNITTKLTRAGIEIKLRRQFPGVRYALTFLMGGSGLALVLETSNDINAILKDARPWLCVNKVPPTMELVKIKAGISKIDPVVGTKNWEI